MKSIILAAGCFWSVQYKLDKLNGVVSTSAVYTNGKFEKVSYEQVCSGETGHAEGVLVKYDENIISTENLLIFFFSIHDATQLNRQGPDIGEQYRSGIFYFDEEQQKPTNEKLQSDQKFKKK